MAAATLPKWLWGILVLPLVFALWGGQLFVSVNRHRTELRRLDRLQSDLGRLEGAVRDLQQAIDRQGGPEFGGEDWDNLLAAYRRTAEGVRESPGISRELRRAAATADERIADMVRVWQHTASRPPPSAAERVGLESRYRVSADTAIDEIKAQLAVAHTRSRQLSALLDSKWNQLNVLVPVACAIAFIAAILLLLRHREVLERRRVEQRLTRQRNILQSIVDNLGEGVAVADETGRLSLLNPAAEKILGLGMIDSGPDSWSELYGLFHADTVTPLAVEDLPLARAVAGIESRDVEVFVRNPKLPGGVFIRVTATPLKDREGALTGGVAVFRDVTERKWAETVLRDSEARFRSMVEATATALIILSPGHRVLEFNPEAERLFGRSRGEVLGQDYLELFVTPRFRSTVATSLGEVLEGGVTADLEYPIRTAAGAERTMLCSVSRLADAAGHPIGVISTGHDITERKESEEAQRVRELAAHLQDAREAERAHIAREIHDALGQELTGLKLEVSLLARHLSEQPQMRERLDAVGRMIDATIGSVRRIATELRPQILDQLGLLEAIRWQAREFQKRTGIGCEVEVPAAEIAWDPDRSTAMFRILQESLTNVARHAEASRVAVRVRRDSGRIVLQVDDDGRGITDDELGNPRSFGLLGMRERARMYGGVVEIERKAGRGTRLTLEIPC